MSIEISLDDLMSNITSTKFDKYINKYFKDVTYSIKEDHIIINGTSNENIIVIEKFDEHVFKRAERTQKMLDEKVIGEITVNQSCIQYNGLRINPDYEASIVSINNSFGNQFYRNDMPFDVWVWTGNCKEANDRGVLKNYFRFLTFFKSIDEELKTIIQGTKIDTIFDILEENKNSNLKLSMFYTALFEKSIKSGTIDPTEKDKYLNFTKKYKNKEYNTAKKLKVLNYLPFLIETEDNKEDISIALQYMTEQINGKDYLNKEIDNLAKNKKLDTRELDFSDIEKLEYSIYKKLSLIIERIFPESNLKKNKLEKLIQDTKKKYALKSSLKSRRSNVPIENLLLEIRNRNSHGNGVLLTEDGYVLTALHCIDPYIEESYVQDIYQNRFPIARIVKQSEKYDLALLKIDRPGDNLPTKLSVNNFSYDKFKEIETLHFTVK